MAINNEKSIIFVDIYEENILKSEEYKEFKKIFSIDKFYFDKKTKELLRSKKRIIKIEIINLFRLILKKNNFNNKNKVIFLNGLHLSFLIYFKFFYKNSLKYKLIISNLYFHKISMYRFFNTFLKYLLHNKKYTIIVQSPNEVEYFREVGNKLKINLIPYSMPELINNEIDLKRGNYFFSGGYTNRDYSILFELAKLNPLQRFVVVASTLNSLNISSIPANVELYLDSLPEMFNQLLANSICVIIPLKEDVGSSGQMVCLAAMQKRKPIIYSNHNVISQYFLSSNSGIEYKRNDLLSLNKAFFKFLNLSENAKIQMGEKAFLNYKNNFGNLKRVEKIIKLINLKI